MSKNRLKRPRPERFPPQSPATGPGRPMPAQHNLLLINRWQGAAGPGLLRQRGRPGLITMRILTGY